MLNNSMGSQLAVDVLLMAPSLGLVAQFFFFNMVYSCIVAAVLVTLISLEIVKKKSYFFFLLAIIGTFIPVIGSIWAIIAVLLLKKYAHAFQPIEINVYPEVEYYRKSSIKTVAYGAGWADVRLHSSQFNPHERQQALLSVSRGLPRDANPIYSQLVSDSNEELRVLAFSLLENQQDYLHTQINTLLKKYNSDECTYKNAFIAKQIALLYWELVYRHLSDQEFKTILLERSYFFAQEALKVLEKDTTVWILLSRVTIEMGHLEKGVGYLERAADYNAPQSKILPYLAEIAYKNKKYNAVRKYLSTDSSLAYIFKINKIIKFWCKK